MYWFESEETTYSQHDRISSICKRQLQAFRERTELLRVSKIAPRTWRPKWCLCSPRRVPYPGFQIVYNSHLHVMTISVPKVLHQVVSVWWYNISMQHRVLSKENSPYTLPQNISAEFFPARKTVAAEINNLEKFETVTA